MTNFDPNEPSTNGKLIENEASQKSGFDAAGPLTYSTHAPKDKHICPLVLPSVKFWTKPTFAPYTPQTFALACAMGSIKAFCSTINRTAPSLVGCGRMPLEGQMHARGEAM